MEQSEIDVTKIMYPPKTIHSLMYILRRNKDVNNIDLVVIDEASTMNSELFAEFVETLQTTSTLSKIKFIMVGDFNQLPPIGGGQIFEDIIGQKIYPVHKLTKIFRTTDKEMLALYNDVLQYDNIKVSKHKKFFAPYDKNNTDEFLERLTDTLFKKDNKWYKDNKCIILAHTNKFIDYINYQCYKKITGNG